MLRTGLAAALIMAASSACADPVENAYVLCALLDKTGLTSSECEVSGWSSTVTTTIDMTSGEARDLCKMVVGFMAEKGLGFDGRWTFHIKSPYSGDNDIAFCDLR